MMLMKVVFFVVFWKGIDEIRNDDEEEEKEEVCNVFDVEVESKI